MSVLPAKPCSGCSLLPRRVNELVSPMIAGRPDLAVVPSTLAVPDLIQQQLFLRRRSLYESAGRGAEPTDVWSDSVRGPLRVHSVSDFLLDLIVSCFLNVRCQFRIAGTEQFFVLLEELARLHRVFDSAGFDPVLGHRLCGLLYCRLDHFRVGTAQCQ